MSHPEPPEPAPGPRGVEVYPGPTGRIVVRFPYANDLIARIKQIPGRRWHAKPRCWTIPAQPAPLALMLSKFRDEDLRVADEVARLMPNSGLDGITWRRLDRAEAGRRAEQRRALERMQAELTLRGYSTRTRRVYLDQVRRFFQTVPVRPHEVSARHVRSYVRTLLERRGLSHSYADQSVSALKFLLKHVAGRPLDAKELPRPKRTRSLPNVLSRREVRAILEALPNRKHQAILMMVYSAGLRVGEVVRLKKTDIDPDRGTVHVRMGKGCRDRMAGLSEVAYEALQAYQRFHPDDGPWLFPGQRPGGHLSERTVQHVFAKARERAGVKKHATVHTLRHSYATHLHEGGIGLRYIQTLLGHKSSRTTEIYTHVSKTDLTSIESPLDRLMGDGSADEPTPDP